MRKFLRINTLRSLMHLFPKQHYCIYRRIYNINLSCMSKSASAGRTQNYFSTLSPTVDVSDNSIKELEEEFPHAQKIFREAVNAGLLLNENYSIPSIVSKMISFGHNKEKVWQTVIKMEWPVCFEVEGISIKKSESLNIAHLYACQRLKNLGVLDSSNKPAEWKDGANNFNVDGSKSDLINIFHKVWHQTGNKDVVPKFNSALKPGWKMDYWHTELHLTYPEEKTFEGSALRMKTAESLASMKALCWLNNQGIVYKKRHLVEFTKEDEKKLRNSHVAPYSICIPTSLHDKMHTVLNEIEIQKALLSSEDGERCENKVIGDASKGLCIKDIITDNVYHQLTDQQLNEKNVMLFEKNMSLEKRYFTELEEIRKAKSLLPICQKRENILKLIDENQVVVLSGDTGCGKSTQVPQFILDHYINQMKGAECNIIVTEPRRLSAVSLAERVAYERGEKVGYTVGYQIRLKKCLPKSNGAILYCTTGMLLRKLHSNPNLEGISHVIIDEVHERNIPIDFIFILLKKILETNKKVKLLIMSASFNTGLFAQYFNCEVIHIPGMMYPVEEFFLEDLLKDIPGIKNVEKEEAFLDPNFFANVINYVDKSQPPGAILCFLPGWQDIRTVEAKLYESQGESSNLFICPIHSRLSHEEQKKIFVVPSDGQRKVILATNIAETSITIDDVKYVVNSGLQKGTQLDVDIGIASLSTQWITKANVRQRKGRAGRVRPGKCYHLFSRKTFMKMNEYPIPEILRMPLESVILDCKLYCPDIKAEEFLSKGMQSPSSASVQIGIQELQILGVLDESENLTALGQIVVHFTLHPRLSVLLIYAAFLGCLDPVLTICAILSLEKEPFVNTLDDKILIKRIKQRHGNGLGSDHIALSRIFSHWLSLSEESHIAEFVEENLLDDQSLLRINKLKELFAEDLYDACIIPEINSYCDYDSSFNAYSNHDTSALAALTAAFFPNVIKILQGQITQGKIWKSRLIYSIIKGQSAYIQTESVVSDENELPSPWLVYFSALKSEARRKTLVSCVSPVPGICLLLLCGKDLSVKNMTNENGAQEDLVVLSIDNYEHLNFSCTGKEADLIIQWRKCVQDIFQLYVQHLRVNCEKREYMIISHSKLLPVLTEIIQTPQVPFTVGEMYEFVNNELISRDL